MRLIFAFFFFSILAVRADFDQIPAPPDEPQQLSGIGAVLKTDGGKAVVQQLLPNGSAGKAGVLVGDVLLEVDGKKTLGMQLNDIVDRIRGPKGTKVHIVVERAGAAAPLTFDIVRKTLTLPAAVY
jgi:carboxyl-terminal processing protease